MKSLTGISQGFGKCIKATFRATISEERLLMTASASKYDHDIIIVKSAESLKLFRYEEVAGR